MLHDKVPRSATDQYAFTIAAWNDNYCYTRDNSRRCPSVGIRVHCARRASGERDSQRERDDRDGVQHGTLYFINVNVLTRRWPSVIDAMTFEFCNCDSSRRVDPPQVSCAFERSAGKFSCSIPPAQILTSLIKSVLRRVSKDFTQPRVSV